MLCWNTHGLYICIHSWLIHINSFNEAFCSETSFVISFFAQKTDHTHCFVFFLYLIALSTSHPKATRLCEKYTTLTSFWGELNINNCQEVFQSTKVNLGSYLGFCFISFGRNHKRYIRRLCLVHNNQRNQVTYLRN